MDLRQSYRFINNRLRTSYRESTTRWGIRVAVSISLPLLWGLLTNNRIEAEWMSIAAECVSLFELKGTVMQRIRMLLMASLFSVLFCLLGTLAGNIVWVMLLGMLVVGFFCVLLKNLGDRGTGLALSVYIFYIIACAYPVQDAAALWNRCFWVGMGALWTTLVGLATFLFIRMGVPYRRTVASVWSAMAALAEAAGSGWNGRAKRLSEREIYLKEKEVRDRLNDSLYLFEEMSDSVKPDSPAYAMAQIRKTAAIVSLYVIQISETALSLLDRNGRQQPDRHLSLQIAGLFRALQQIGERMGEFILTLKYEEQVLVLSRLERLARIATIIQQSSEEGMAKPLQDAVSKIYLYSQRVNHIVRHALKLVNQSQSEKRVFQAYSFAQTLQILHPQYIRNNLKQLLNFNSITTRYALRIGISLFIASLIATIFFHSHGYWIAFTTIIVAQPYFGATLKKGLQRSMGTISGIIIGTAILQISFPVASKVILVFVSSLLLVVYLRKQYAIAAFFITLMLVGILSLEPGMQGKALTDLFFLRISGTLIGSALAIAAGFLLLPNWDKHLFPNYQLKALQANRDYFIHTFYSNQSGSWLRFKRTAETQNANAFDSLSRFIKEPGHRKGSENENFFYWITHNVRITRELNNFNSESELEEAPVPIPEKEKYMQLLSACDSLFRETIQMIRKRLPVAEKYKTTPASYPVQGFNPRDPTEAQLISVEKLWMELKYILEVEKGILQDKLLVS